MLTQTSNKEKKKNKNKEAQVHHGLKTHNHEFQQIKSDAYPNIKQRKKSRETNFHHHGLIQLNQMQKPKYQTKKKKEKKKNREANFLSPIFDSM